MAKKQPLDLFDKTERDKAEQDKIKAGGIGLKESEWAEVDKLAAALGVTRHSFLVYGIRYFIENYKAGKIKAQPQTKKTL